MNEQQYGAMLAAYAFVRMIKTGLDRNIPPECYNWDRVNVDGLFAELTMALDAARVARKTARPRSIWRHLWRRLFGGAS